MDITYDNIFYSNKPINLITGQNGAGKSFALSKLADTHHLLGYSVIKISNTIHDKFNTRKGNYVGPRSGSDFPERSILKCLFNSLRNRDYRLESFNRVLDYCGLGSRFSVKFYINRFSYNEDDRILESTLSKSDNGNEILYLIKEILGHAELDENSENRFISVLNFNLSRMSSFDAHILSITSKHIGFLRKSGFVRKVGLKLSSTFDPREMVDSSQASSGQLYKLASLLKINNKTSFHDRNKDLVILIDEPENSLHPEWQKEYISEIINLSNYSIPKIYIATHAPMIISGAVEHHRNLTNIWSASNGILEQIKEPSPNIEEILLENLDTVSPMNSYLSRKLSALVQDLNMGALSKTKALEEINSIIRHDISRQQKELLEKLTQVIDENYA